MLTVTLTSDPETSEEDLRQSQKDVLYAMKVLGRGTDERLLWCYKIMAQKGFVSRQADSRIRTRRQELVRAGHIQRSGQREQLPDGRMAIVWEHKSWA